MIKLDGIMNVYFFTISMIFYSRIDVVTVSHK